MMVQAEIGDGSHVSVFVYGLSPLSVMLVRHIVVAIVLVPFAIGINHQHVVLLMRKSILFGGGPFCCSSGR
jgi:hypothetical protein